jgi:hypothetical protein
VGEVVPPFLDRVSVPPLADSLRSADEYHDRLDDLLETELRRGVSVSTRRRPSRDVSLI